MSSRSPVTGLTAHPGANAISQASSETRRASPTAVRSGMLRRRDSAHIAQERTDVRDGRRMSALQPWDEHDEVLGVEAETAGPSRELRRRSATTGSSTERPASGPCDSPPPGSRPTTPAAEGGLMSPGPANEFSRRPRGRLGLFRRPPSSFPPPGGSDEASLDLRAYDEAPEPREGFPHPDRLAPATAGSRISDDLSVAE